MKFVYDIYILIIILKSVRLVRNAANFTLEELTQISRELNSAECMRLLESSYLAIPKEKENRVGRGTPTNTWISKYECLNELKAWNHQFPDEAAAKARVVMIQHLNSLGKTDLANNVGRKNRNSLTVEANDRENKKIFKDRIFKKDTYYNKISDHHPRAKIHTRDLKRPKISKRSNNIHHPMIAAISEQVRSNVLVKSDHRGKWNDLKISKNALFLIIALGIVVIFICGIVFLILGKSLQKNYSCGSCKRSDLCPCYNIAQEKGLEIHCLDDYEDYETQSNFMASQISEIDVEGGSCVNSVGVDSRKSFSDAVLYDESMTPRISIEKLKLLDEDEEPVTDVQEESQPPMSSSCRCRPLEDKICGSKPKRKKKKTKTKSREETKTTRNYFKVMQEKILSRQRSPKIKQDCNFDMRQFQDKILTVLNEECGICQCCNCTAHFEIDGSKDNNKCARREKKECKKKQLKRDKCEKLSITKGCDREPVSTCQASVTSRSPMSDRRSNRKQESDTGKKCKIKKKEKIGKAVTSEIKKSKDNRIPASSSSETDQDYNNDDKREGKFKSKRSKQLDASVNTLFSAHEKPKRFF